ncbi:glycosyl hydrolase family 2 [Haloferula helveola]|uniref:Glycosyl hydrolase family 2 n=1 Tax=Haloferula helveola TaxID=490095 RepID=A0ABM7RRJ6_9BACT|nr:glycosyl hydrolase family 2 [Haloferula helveola]
MISVLLPFRNASPTISSAVRSILGQSHSDFELLAIDDGSEDDSCARLGAETDPRIRLIRMPTSAGIVPALQAGLEQARGEWIARMDADDISHRDRLSLQLEIGERNQLDVVSSKVRLIDACGRGMQRYVEWTNSLVDSDAIAASRFIECPVIHPSVLVRRDALLKAGGYADVPWAEDHDLWLRMLERGGRFGRIQRVLLDWRDSPRRLTRSDPRYGESARTEMRCHYLSRLSEVKRSGVVVAGAGPIGKRLARGLMERNVAVHGFLEVHPRRIGESIQGVPVVAAEELNQHWPDAVVLGAVGIEGGREQVSSLALEHGRVEGHDFWSVC